MGHTARYYSVVMGDLVSSETKHAPAKLHRIFNDVVAAANEDHKKTLASPLTITLGDEFQGLTHTLSDALPIVQDLRFALMEHGVDCRFVIGLVDLKTRVNPEKAWNMMGPGLGRARDKLEDKRSGQYYRFSLAKAPTLERVLEAIGAGLVAIEEDWTDQQRRDIIASLRGAKATELAKERKVSVHSIYKVRSAGKFDAYVTQWQAITEALEQTDKDLKLA